MLLFLLVLILLFLKNKEKRERKKLTENVATQGKKEKRSVRILVH